MRVPIVLVRPFILSAFLINTFGPVPGCAYADEYRLPLPGVMVHLSPPLAPPVLKGIKVYPDDPFRFDFILDKGVPAAQTQGMSETQEQLKTESARLVRYFLASLTIPEKDLWVNLSPYEKDRIAPSSFGLTEMGRDLLAEDYMLKQITASLIYPQDPTGMKFWARVYAQALKKFGTTDIPVNTFNKVWIVPEKAVVYENAKQGTAYVVDSRLKVMLEQDYLALSHSVIADDAKRSRANVSALGSQVVREIVIPQLTKEVNEDKNFARLRQVYDSLILATWYKEKIKDSILSQVYSDKRKVAGVNVDDPNEKERIYQRYLKAFKKGVFDYIQEDIDPGTRKPIPRKYFSGGVMLSLTGDTDLASSSVMTVVDDGKVSPAMVSVIDKAQSAGSNVLVVVNVKPEANAQSQLQRGDAAMAVDHGRVQGGTGYLRGFVGIDAGRRKTYELERRSFLRLALALGVAAAVTQPMPVLAQDKAQSVDADSLNEFRDFIAQIRASASFSLPMRGEEAKQVLGYHSSRFAELYDLLIERLAVKSREKGGFERSELKPYLLEIGDDIIAQYGGEFAGGNEGDVDAVINRFNGQLRDAGGSNEIERVLLQFELYLRQVLDKTPDASPKLFKAMMGFNALLIPKGFLIEQSPLGLQDEKAIVLYQITQKEIHRIANAIVPVYHVTQVTKYADGRLRGNNGWSNYFTDYVVVFDEVIEQDARRYLEAVNGNKATFYASRATDTGVIINRLADLQRDFLQKAFPPGRRNASDIEKVMKDIVSEHEVEHKLRGIRAHLKEGAVVHTGDEERAAILASMYRPPDTVFEMARMFELAAASFDQRGLVFSWQILIGLSGINTKGKTQSKIIDETIGWARGFLNRPQLREDLRNRAAAHYKDIFGYAPATGTIDRAMMSRRDILKSAGAAGLGAVLRPLGVLTAVSAGLMPIKVKALTKAAQEFIVAQNVREGLELRGIELNPAAERALNQRLADFLADHSDKLDQLPYLKKFIGDHGLALTAASPYSMLVKALKGYFDGIKGRHLAVKELENVSGLQADAVEFIQTFLLEGARYVSMRRAVVGLIFGFPGEGFIYNCDAVSALTVMIGNDMGIDTVYFAVVHRDHEGKNYPDAQGIGHANNVLFRADGKAMVFDQRIKVEQDNPYERLEAYDDKEKPVVVALSSVGPKTKFMTIQDLLEEEKAINLLKQVEVDGAYTTQVYKDQADLERGQRVLDEVVTYKKALQRNPDIRGNFENAMQALRLGYYNKVIETANAGNDKAKGLFDAHDWYAAADAFKSVADYVKAQEAKFAAINGFPQDAVAQLRDISKIALQNQETALSNARNAATVPTETRNGPSPSSSATEAPAANVGDLFRSVQDKTNALIQFSVTAAESGADFETSIDRFNKDQKAVEQGLSLLSGQMQGITITDEGGRKISIQQYAAHVRDVMTKARENIYVGELKRLFGLYNRAVSAQDAAAAKDVGARLRDIKARYAPIPDRLRPDFDRLLKAADRAMLNDLGGIDLSSGQLHIQIRQDASDIHFRFDPAQLSQLENAPGFSPRIISVSPLSDLLQFLGLKNSID